MAKAHAKCLFKRDITKRGITPALNERIYIRLTRWHDKADEYGVHYMLHIWAPTVLSGHDDLQTRQIAKWEDWQAIREAVRISDEIAAKYGKEPANDAD